MTEKTDQELADATRLLSEWREFISAVAEALGMGAFPMPEAREDMLRRARQAGRAVKLEAGLEQIRDYHRDNERMWGDQPAGEMVMDAGGMRSLHKGYAEKAAEALEGREASPPEACPVCSGTPLVPLVYSNCLVCHSAVATPTQVAANAEAMKRASARRGPAA